MQKIFSGREEEIEILNDLYNSDHAELVAVMGRRRVGKTHLIKHVFSPRITYELTGAKDTPVKQQLKNFTTKLNECFRKNLKAEVPENWFDAFEELKRILERQKTKKKHVLFFDELPWLATHRSGFLEAFGYFWNDWACYQPVMIVVCGSATTWMTKHIVNHKGSLHNRITRQIHLRPFTLGEVETFLKARKVNLTRFDITRLYFVTGGIPYYLSQIKPGKSLTQIINQLCFHPQGILYDEFDKLFMSLFEKAETHISVIKALAGKWKGLTRQQLVTAIRASDGGSITRALTELEQSDFIIRMPPFAKSKKDTLYRVSDHFILFYLRFILPAKLGSGANMQSLSNSPTWYSWCGYAFENTCIYHLPQIKNALGISGIHTESSGFFYKGGKDAEGVQIDWLINRSDNIIHLVEVKFSVVPFVIQKKYAETMRYRRELFLQTTGTRKNAILMMLTAAGLTKNAYALELIPNHLDINCLFLK
jgi:AAA+ ATPase superfamily predicted ATPase